jgi:multidrug efflux pump subunit AcrA (membrane-fusion protein)
VVRHRQALQRLTAEAWSSVAKWDRVEVVDGLKPGETVVVTGQLNLAEGTLVRITNAK